MSASTMPSGILGSSVVFAGGLALGVGGALALSRSSFAPATKPSRNVKDKAAKALGGVAAGAAAAGGAATAAAARSDSSADAVPASQVLDAVDAKGAGPAAPSTVNRDIKPLVVAKSARISTPVIGSDVPEPSAQNRANHAETRMDLSGPLPSVEAAPAAREVPAWLAGLPESTLKATSSGVIETVAYRSSTALFVYESATNAGFGSWVEREAADAARKGFVVGRPKVLSMQTRAGAGSAIAGYLAEKGGSSFAGGRTNGAIKKVVSALTNADGLLAMAPALSALPTNDARLVLQVSSAAQDAESLSVSNDYASVLAAAASVSAVDGDFTIVLSSGRQEAVDVASASYAPGIAGHVAHVFDGAYAAREVGPLAAPEASATTGTGNTVVDALQAKGLSHFAYSGPASPTAVIVVPNGSHFAGASAVLAKLSDDVTSQVGIIGARIVRPWSDEALLKAFPESVKVAHVVEECRLANTPGVLFDDVSATVLGALGSRKLPAVQPASLTPGQHLGSAQWAALLKAAAASTSALNVADVLAKAPEEPVALLASSARVATFIDADQSSTAALAGLVARTFRERGQAGSRLLSRYDNFAAQGLVRHDVVLGPVAETDAPLDLAAQAGSQTLVIGEPATTLKSHDVFASLAPGATVIINAPGWTGSELDGKLVAADKRTLATKRARVYLVDTGKLLDQLQDETAVAKGGKSKLSAAEVPKEAAAAALAAVLLKSHLGFGPDSIKATLSRSLGVAPLGINGVSGLVDAVPRFVELVAFSNAEWAKAEPLSEAEADQAAARPSKPIYTSFGPNVAADEAAREAAAVRTTWALPAWQTMFSEAYDTDTKALRPDLPEKTWTVKVTENRRLTPVDYDRNVFHMELSTKGTDLKYEIGEALGVHGWNDADEVRDFIAWAGYDADEVVSVPSPSDPKRYETRTVFQLLQQVLDVFGKPGKGFYAELAELAQNADEARWLRFISSAEGTSTFKKLADVETVTYADVLRMFPSARLPLDRLMKLVEPIKPRHYSIASAQADVGESIHLLIVTVDWVSPSGSPRYGQCTRYLANLKPGAEVTVSLKPSVMKLPPVTTQPIIMAGLGTGAAPFRAFIQARDVQKRQGAEIGPVYYLFGSRTAKAEYLYGEELEAYAQDDVVSHLRTAFSRDQAKKIYVQHRLLEDAQEVAKWMLEEREEHKGYFFVCGPTWPVPDITEALLKGLETVGGLTRQQAEAKIEELKEEERFILEVY